MNFYVLIKSSWRSLSSSKTRSLLTTLGVIIGVATVITMVSIVDGINKYVYSTLSVLGTKSVYIQKYKWLITGRRRREFRKWARYPDFTLQDVEFIRSLTFIKDATAYQNVLPSIPVHYRDKYTDASLVGSDYAGYRVLNEDLEEGRWFTYTDVKEHRRVCIIGYEVKDVLFGKAHPIGRTVRIGRHSYLVIGVLKKKGATFGNSGDNVVYIPITTTKMYARTWRSALWGSLSIAAVFQDDVPLNKGIELLRMALRKRRHLSFDQEDNFFINTQEQIVSTYKKITGGIYIAMIAIASLALLVGGIGIMNIMLVSVTERTREIGIRMAVGARRRDILLQFLVESNILTLTGGVIGVIVGFLLAALISLLTPLKSSVSLWSVLVGVVFSMLVGIFFGMYPANKASKLDPVEALRYE